MCALALDNAQLSVGWHALETGAAGLQRWTQGAATLPTGVESAEAGGAVTLEVTLGGFAEYGVEAKVSAPHVAGAADKLSA